MIKLKKREIYNIGGGRKSNSSVLEAIELGESIFNLVNHKFNQTKLFLSFFLKKINFKFITTSVRGEAN